MNIEKMVMLKLQLGFCTFFAMCLLACLSEAVHFDHFSQRAQAKSATNQNRNNETPKGKTVATEQQVTVSPRLSGKHASENPNKTVNQLQLEIQELKQMQNQLELEISKGKDNSKEKLLHHIKTQIHLRQIRVKQQNEKEPVLSKQPSNVSKPRHYPLNKVDTNETTGKYQETPKAVHGSELLQTWNQTKKYPTKQMSQHTKTIAIKEINSTPQRPVTHNQHSQSLGHQGEVNIKDSYIKDHQPPPPPPPLTQQQQPYQISQMFPEKIVQHQAIGSAPLHQGQLNLIGQPAININRAIYQPGTQQILVPINALPVNNVFPSQILPNERIIVIEAVSDKYGQPKDTKSSLVVKSGQETLQKIPLPTESAPVLQTSPATTTSSPSTTSAITTSATISAAAASSSHTTIPTPPTTYSYIEETTADPDYFKQEFYKGEIRRQKLEIKKLQLEIRALQRSEFESLSPHRGGGENEDAPPRPRLRFAARGMPFPFFKRK